jgi:hypothetical protein
MLNPSGRWRWAAIVLGLATLLSGCAPSSPTASSDSKQAPASHSGKDSKSNKPPVQRDPG